MADLPMTPTDSDSSDSDSSGTDSSGTDPSGADPSGADPSGTNPSGADSSGADSSGTDPSSDALAPEPSWQQGMLVEVRITDLTDTGDGVGRVGQRVVFVPDTVPGDRVQVRLIRAKPRYAYGKVYDWLEPSPHRVRPSCIVADKCGGCQWQHIRDDYQLTAKYQQVYQALERIGGFSSPPVDAVLAAPSTVGYRNKATYPLAIAPDGQVKAGYYRKGSHQVVNLNQCPTQDSRLDPLLAGIKQDIEVLGWPIYNEETHRGNLRHLALRIGRRTGDILLTLVVRDWQLPGLEEQAQTWMTQYPGLVGVCLNRNPDRTNAIFGSQTQCVVGQPYLREEFANLQFLIHPTTFFQVYTEQAEALVTLLLGSLNLQGHETVVDAYCGIGTLTLPLARQVRQVIGLEIQPEAVQQARTNAALNGITNITFLAGTVADLLPTLDSAPDLVLLDPPRKGCEPQAIAHLLDMSPLQIIYVSCKPATLARDLQRLCQGGYVLNRVQPVDFFPKTAHVECVAFLQR